MFCFSYTHLYTRGGDAGVVAPHPEAVPPAQVPVAVVVVVVIQGVVGGGAPRVVQYRRRYTVVLWLTRQFRTQVSMRVIKSILRRGRSLMIFPLSHFHFYLLYLNGLGQKIACFLFVFLSLYLLCLQRKKKQER